eukprot:CAMPEP_0116007282 /NCGR_PEP_ID=MMETSP0321-20121206/2209_1 /TAXON_ID=163516 /ORGANISM="Leptocylindrus danicus var. danicus, Strain B650" /LENGTH=504 /DNA_ID=CAMNT_0003475953 /DNA_START=166 /DNA_END=1680 /DNA_ORIENTATION=-
MRYRSTRSDTSVSYSFEEALSSGYAPDGGLFVPVEMPKVSSQTLATWADFTFDELAYSILSMFISETEIDRANLREIITRSFDSYDCAEIVPVKKLTDSLFVSELFHGPTFCFKDLGMKPVVNLLAYFSARSNIPTTLLISTTGDTGPAAMRAVSEVRTQERKYMRILVHYPLGQISAFQRRQLTTIKTGNARVAAFEGTGDDMDVPIKRLLLSNDRTTNRICGINSYNIGRPIMQVVHFVWTYLQIAKCLEIVPGDKSAPIDIVIPTGAMGNMIGGYIAKLMGVPIKFLCAGVNANDITHRAFASGEFHKSDAMTRTLSEAINIQVPYNFERLLFYLTGSDYELVNQWMTTMDETSKLTLDSTWLLKLQAEFRSARIDDEEMCATMRKIKDRFAYMIDPHTSVAFAAASRLGYDLGDGKGDKNPVAVMATASPCKFEETVTVAIGEKAWYEYYESEVSEDAKRILSCEEVPPMIYHRTEGLSLEETQNEWEKIARTIIEEELC